MLRKLLTAMLLLPGAALAQTTALENGVAVAVPDTAEGTVRTYSLVVSNNMTELRVVMTGGAGDADLYVHYDEPFFGSGDLEADCESLDPDTPEEECVVTAPLPGTWYIQVDAFTDFGNGVQLVAVASVELADDVDEPISGADGSANWYFIDVPAGQGHLVVTTVGGSGNPNMVVGPELFAAPECSSGSSGTVDSCEIDQPAAGVWFVRISGADPYAGVILNAEYGPERADIPDASAGGAPALPTLGGLLLAALVRRRIRDRSGRVP